MGKKKAVIVTVTVTAILLIALGVIYKFHELSGRIEVLEMAESNETNYENYEAYLDVVFPSDGETLYKVVKTGATFFSDVDMNNQIKDPTFSSMGIKIATVKPGTATKSGITIYSYRLDNGKICYSLDCFDDPANWSDTSGRMVH